MHACITTWAWLTYRPPQTTLQTPPLPANRIIQQTKTQEPWPGGVAQTVSLCHKFKKERKGENGTEGKADWQLLITQPPAGAHKLGGRASLIWYLILALSQARRLYTCMLNARQCSKSNRTDKKHTKGVLSDSIRSPARCYTRVLGPNSPSSRQHVAYCVGNPSIGGSEIWGTMCWNIRGTKENRGISVNCKAVEGQGDKVCMWRWCQCVKVAEAVIWLKYARFEANVLPFLTVGRLWEWEERRYKREVERNGMVQQDRKEKCQLHLHVLLVGLQKSSDTPWYWSLWWSWRGKRMLVVSTYNWTDQEDTTHNDKRRWHTKAQPNPL